MPSKSQKQHNLMAMVANDPKAAKRVGIPQSVGQEFMKADKGRKFGGPRSRADVQAINKPKTEHGKSSILKGGGEVKESKAMMRKEVSFLKKKGAPKSMIKHEESEMKGMKKGGKVKKMMDGGVSSQPQSTRAAERPTFREFASRGKEIGNRFFSRMRGGMKAGGVASSKMGAVKTAAPSRDGVAVKGKTKGKMITMRKGGKAC